MGRQVHSAGDGIHLIGNIWPTMAALIVLLFGFLNERVRGDEIDGQQLFERPCTGRTEACGSEFHHSPSRSIATSIWRST